uniref:BZIP domain-containing protein n=1 Tax=Melanopsichium pennsylvanicum 4 TaxID=1398559 RepID=A0A077R3A8_9BASI|nr:conserved hypothetical protein [Melanopsichium pennsylvanicum 4]
MGRGRRPNLALEPTRALQTQRAFRQRKAQHLANLEDSINSLTQENAKLRKLLHLDPPTSKSLYSPNGPSSPLASPPSSSTSSSVPTSRVTVAQQTASIPTGIPTPRSGSAKSSASGSGSASGSYATQSATFTAAASPASAAFANNGASEDYYKRHPVRQNTNTSANRAHPLPHSTSGTDSASSPSRQSSWSNNLDHSPAGFNRHANLPPNGGVHSSYYPNSNSDTASALAYGRSHYASAPSVATPAVGYGMDHQRYAEYNNGMRASYGSGSSPIAMVATTPIPTATGASPNNYYGSRSLYESLHSPRVVVRSVQSPRERARAVAAAGQDMEAGARD